MGMGHVPQDPFHSVGEGSQFQRRERRGAPVGGHPSPQQLVAAQRRARAQWAEELVARWYTSHGFTVVARNWTMRGGELDIVAHADNVLVVCEVKARASSQFGDPIEAITPRKVARVQRAGYAFLAEWKQQHSSFCTLRFDVATVLGTHLEVHENFF